MSATASENAPGEVEQAHALGHDPLPRMGYDALLDRAATRFGEQHTLFEFPDSGARLTVADLPAGADQVARALLVAGLETGDTLAVWSPASPFCTMADRGCARAGPAATAPSCSPYRTSSASPAW